MAQAHADGESLPVLVARGVVGGILMGLANLVPGISGGTMLLAVGIYPQFIEAIGQVTTFRFCSRAVLMLVSVVLAALVAVVALAGPVKDLVVEHRWVMYSLFIGLTIGGAPVVWRLIRQDAAAPGRGVWVAAVLGFLAMTLLAWFQVQNAGGVNREGFGMMFSAGAAGAAAMILPGVSGGYLLLVLGVYVPLLSGIEQAKEAVGGQDIGALTEVGLRVIVPVGLGVVVGVVMISNLLRFMLARFEKWTLGLLLGLLLGAVIGLWPFQTGVEPSPGAWLKGQAVQVGDSRTLVFAESGKSVDPEDYPTQFFRPTFFQIGSGAGLIVTGFLTTLLIDRIGGRRQSD